MEATLIITVYKDAEALRAVLKSAALQTKKCFEIIVAQDADAQDLEEVIATYSNQLNIKHLQQEDNGFRKNKILNEAVRVAQTDRLIFVDGDCVLHKNFVKQYIRRIVPNRISIGRRVMTDGGLSRQMRNGKITSPSFTQLLFSQSKQVEEGIYAPWISAKHKPNPHLLGCNMGWHKSDLLKLNGFDEDYVHPGFGEDVDVEMRGLLMGMTKYSMRFKAVQYHLHHERPDREDQINFSRATYQLKKEKGEFRCVNGLIKD